MFYETESRQQTPGFNPFGTMSLMSHGPSTIDNTDKPKKDNFRADRPSNHIDDIEGAKPFLKHTRFVNKPNSYENHDIHGAKPKQLIRNTNAPDYTLYHDDIEGSKPKPSTFKATRMVDPLNPQYQLPSYNHVPAPEPAFLRETNAIDDIKGTRPKPRTKYMPRNGMNTQDIEGTTVGWRPRHARVTKEGDTREIMKVKDITDGGFKSKRSVDPLRPTYVVNGMDIGDDMTKSMPKKLPQGKNEPFYSLVTEDIEGTQPGWKPPAETKPPMSQRRHWRNTNFVGDIAGAAPDTVNHAIRTNRVVNPLNPAYVSLDGEILENPATPLYKDPGVVEAQNMLASSTMNATRHSRGNNQMDDRHSYSSGVGSSSRYGGSSRVYSQAGSSARQHMTPDDKDKLIAQLEREVHDLRSSQQISSHSQRFSNSQRLTPQSQREGYMTPSARYASPIKRSEATPDFSRSMESSLRSAGSSISRGSEFVPPRTSLPPSGKQSERSYASKRHTPSSSKGSGLVLRSQSAKDNFSSSERLILQSSNGEPRVHMTPAERREARALEADVNSVRDLI